MLNQPAGWATQRPDLPLYQSTQAVQVAPQLNKHPGVQLQVDKVDHVV
jgi:hypothetical protein